MDTTKQKALAMLADGKSTAEIAKRLGVSQRTIQRWLKLDGVTNPVKEVCDRVVERVSLCVEAEIGDQLKAQALQLLKLSGKSLDCLEQILDNPESRNADKLKACQIIGEWVGMGVAKVDLATHTLNKFGLEIAVTPYGSKTLQDSKPTYPLEREYEVVEDTHGNRVGITKRLSPQHNEL